MSKRKPYKPRPVSPIGGLVAIDRRSRAVSYLSSEQIAELGIAYRLAYQNMTDGNADEYSWSVVVGAMNIGIALAEGGYGREYIPYFRSALDACWRAKLRADRMGKWGFDGDGHQAVKAALEIHDAQVERALIGDLTAAIREVHRRYDKGISYQAMGM